MTALRSDIPDWTLERFLADDLPAADAERVRRAAETNPSVKARLDALRRDNAEILLAHPPRLVAPQIEKKAGIAGRAPARRFLAFAAPLAVGVAVIAFVVRPSEDVPFTNENQLVKDDTTQLKGAIPGISSLPAPISHEPTGIPQLHVYRRLGTIIEELPPGATARAGDTLQLSYASLGSTYGVVLSIDGRGGVTLHYPERAGQAQKLLPSGEVSLEHAYELDDAPGYERFFIVGSEAPVDIDAVLAGARSLAKDPDRAASAYLDLPGGVRQNSFTLRKERP